jgi:hypothetical protein
MSTSRSDPGGGVVGFAIVLLTFVFGGIVLDIPLPVYFLLIAVGTVLAVSSAGLSGFGLAALVLGAFIFAMPLVTGLGLAVGASPDLEEPIPVPSGYGLVLESDSTNIMHVYASKTLLGKEKAVAKAQGPVLDYYVKHLQDLGWTVVSLDDDSAEFKAPDSDVGIGVHLYFAAPSGQMGAGTLVVQIQAERCPDENYCEPARISDVKPYTG